VVVGDRMDLFVIAVWRSGGLTFRGFGGGGEKMEVRRPKDLGGGVG
jgi:hypothetical protein